MARRRSYGYRNRNAYYTNAEGQEVMSRLIDDIAKSQPIIKSNLSEIKRLQKEITFLEKEESESSEDKYSRIREIHAATQDRVRDYFIANGHFVKYVDINSEYTKIEIMLDRYNSRNFIKLSFGEYDFRNRHEIVYDEHVHFEFQNLTPTEATRVFSLGNFIIGNMGDILGMMGDSYCEIDDIRNNVKAVNNSDKVRQLRTRMEEYYKTAAECIHMQAIIDLATKRNSMFEGYISEGNKQYMRYAVIKEAKYRTDKRVDNFTQFIQTKNKFMLVNGDSQDFLEISKSKVVNYVPVIMAGSTELIFDMDSIKSVIRSKVTQ